MRRVAPMLAMLAAVAAGGCAGGQGRPLRELMLSDFAAPPADLPLDVVRTSVAPREDPPTAETAVASSVRPEGGAQANGSASAIAPSGATPGRQWPVDALVGQINGRPVFANRFFEPEEDRLRNAAAMQDRAEGRRVFVEIVRRSFKQLVDSELVVAEAESRLSPEQQEGLLGWLRSIQEETIAQRGGTRAAAEASLEVEEAKTLDQFMQMRRDYALASRLLNERVDPRVIVSWRDIVQEYERRRSEFNPRATVRIGRIRLGVQSDAERIALVRQRVEEGRGFAEIAEELKLPEGGFWNSFELPAEGIAGLDLSDTVKERLAGLEPGRPSRPIEARDFISWLAIMEIQQPPARSIYDREVQLQLRAELEARRRIIERERYIGTLRSRWVSDDIGAMERRLVDIALERYWN
ncbi:MAG: hypothetical protein ACKO0W_04050 [Planctomycetota bacterium]